MHARASRISHFFVALTASDFGDISSERGFSSKRLTAGRHTRPHGFIVYATPEMAAQSNPDCPLIVRLHIKALSHWAISTGHPDGVTVIAAPVPWAVPATDIAVNVVNIRTGQTEWLAFRYFRLEAREFIRLAVTAHHAHCRLDMPFALTEGAGFNGPRNPTATPLYRNIETQPQALNFSN